MIDPASIRDPSRYAIGRRGALAGVASLAALIAEAPRRAFAKETITVADPGGAWTPACDAAFVQPFAKEADVTINHVAREHYPTVEIKANVDTKSYTWDAVIATDADQTELAPQGLLEPLDWNNADMAEIMPQARRPDWMGQDVYSTIIAWRTDKFGKNGPQNWADFWDVQRFPGRRAMHKHPIDMLEAAVLADGVPIDKVYPIDVDRAFKKLDQIKQHVDVWWTGGAQTTQMLQSGEVDLLPTWNARAQVVIEAGGPVAIAWDQGIYALEGWVVPKGDPHAAMAERFITFCANAKRQADFVSKLAYGPTNPNAYKYIPAERAKLLPTAPGNLKLMLQSNNQWWAQNKGKMLERFNAWLLA
ncbi:MAG TPA: ABC transporter substrate-binding protein [Acidisphaera sp.]|nr:ABC transporter substrate-binding protein [Acidisphaera sp.]